MEESGPEGFMEQDPPPAIYRTGWIVTIALGLFVVWAFLPALNNSFVAWDDPRNLLENPHFRGLGPAQLNWAWTTFWLGAYQPLAWMLFGAQYVCCQLDPRAYHFTSLVFQVANSVVLYLLTLALVTRCEGDSGREGPWTLPLCAGLATALFAVHPLRVETVAWASCQPYLPCILFSMLAVIAYLRAFPTDSSPRWRWLVGSFLLFVTAMLFKAVAVSLPFALLILDVYPLRRFPDGAGRWFGATAWKALLEKVPFAVTSLLFMWLAVAAKPDSRLPVEGGTAVEGVFRASYAIWFYLIKTIVPVNLIAFYPLPIEQKWIARALVLSILATLAMTSGLFLLRRRWPGLLAVWLAYLVILAPNSGLIQISGQIAADRYSYMSMLGLVMLTAVGFRGLWRASSRWHRDAPLAMVAIGFGVLLVLTTMTRNQCRTWRDSETLWTHALAHGGNSSFVAHSNLGTVLYMKGQIDAAEVQYTEAVRLRPTYANAHNNLGNVFYAQGKYDAAKAQFTEAIRLDPTYIDAHVNLGTILSRASRYSEAEAHYAQAALLNPASAQAHNDLAVVLYAQGKLDPAVAHFQEAIRLNPNDAQARNNLGMIFFRQTRYAEAKPLFAEAIRLYPGFAAAHFNLGNVAARFGDYERAKAHYADAIRTDPGYVLPYNASAMIMSTCPETRSRDGKLAVELATRACELTNWKSPSSLASLAAAHAEAGEFDAAVRSQNRAIALLTNQAQIDEYRSRLKLYAAKKPYRQTPIKDVPAQRRS